MAKYVLHELEEARKTRRLTPQEAHALWKLRNPEKVKASERRRKAKNKAYQAAKAARLRLAKLARDPDYERRKSQEWRDAHPGYTGTTPEKLRESSARYARNHPEKPAAHARRRRALKKGAQGSHTQEEIDHLFTLQRGICANPYCRADLTYRKKHLDHKQALTRGGSNSVENLQWLCYSCNSRKSNYDEHVWLQREAERFVRSLHPAIQAAIFQRRSSHDSPIHC